MSAANVGNVTQVSQSSEVVTELHGGFSNENKIQMQCMTYLDDKNTSITSILKYKCIKLVFVKYNWTLPSSALVECLFNTARHIETSRGNQLSDKNFEVLLLLKSNKEFYKA